MGSDMLVRDLYLPTGTSVDLAAAKTTASRLCRNATVDDMRILLDEDWISDDSLPDRDDWTDVALAERAETLRAAAEQEVHRLLDRFSASLQGRHVARFRFDNAANDDGRGGVDAYVTGGLSAGDTPTNAYNAWDIIFETDRFPGGWCDRIGAACGLLHPHGDGPAAATVTLHAWSAPALDESRRP